jgi:opacity protein-like surface antigen
LCTQAIRPVQPTPTTTQCCEFKNANLTDSAGHSYSFDKGWGYGLGVQAMFGKNLFGQLEYMPNQYTDRDAAPGGTVKLESNVSGLAAGYEL